MHASIFTSSKRTTEEQLAKMDTNQHGLLWPEEEEKLSTHAVELNMDTLAFEGERRGTLREDYFTPYNHPYRDGGEDDMAKIALCERGYEHGRRSQTVPPDTEAAQRSRVRA